VNTFCRLKSTESLFLEGPPILIVNPGLEAGILADEMFQVLPKLEVVEERVHPAVDDAVAGIELALVVVVVLLVADDETRLLEELDHGVRLLVLHVRPLVELVCQDPQDDPENY